MMAALRSTLTAVDWIVLGSLAAIFLFIVYSAALCLRWEKRWSARIETLRQEPPQPAAKSTA